MQDFLKDKELLETVFFTRNAVQQSVNFEDGRHPESDPVSRIVKHFFDGMVISRTSSEVQSPCSQMCSMSSPMRDSS